MPNGADQPKFVVKKPAWCGAYNAGDHQLTLMSASTVPIGTFSPSGTTIFSTTPDWKISTSVCLKRNTLASPT